MFWWLHRSVNSRRISQVRDDIAQSVRAVRIACLGRKCLRECVKRMIAAAPLRLFPRRGGAAAIVAALVIVCALCASADVSCTWNGSGYICSGEGNVVRVEGGDCWGDDKIVTNIVGTCTNCVAMSPEYVREWKSRALELIGTELEYDGLFEYCRQIINYSHDIQENLAPYTNYCEVSQFRGSFASGASNLRIATNFLHGVGAFAGETARNKAAELTQGVNFGSYGGNVDNQNRSRLSFYDGAASAYNDFVPNAHSSIYAAEDVESNAVQLQTGLRSLRTMIDELSDEECTAQWDGSGSGSGSGGDNVVTNQVGGNWCTYDQGEAIKDLLGDVKQWLKRQENYFNVVSNRVISIDEIIKSALFSSYTHIPTEDELQTTWQELYLSGGNDNFPEYPATNIVARIELLLAGISGVLTNVSDYVSQDEFADESLDATNVVDDAIGDFTNSFANVMHAREESTRSIGDALIGLYQKFRTWSGTPFSTEYLINSYSVEFESGQSLDVPGFGAAAKTLPWANLIRVICRSAMSVIWIFMTIAVFVRFQIAFFQWCFNYVKWAVEVLQGLFV